MSYQGYAQPISSKGIPLWSIRTPKTPSTPNSDHRTSDGICGGSGLDEPPGASPPPHPAQTRYSEPAASLTLVNL